MSVQSLESMLSTLFCAPGRAALEAEAGYRNIWSEWLVRTKSLVGDDLTRLNALMPLAPVLRIAGGIELALTMRVASVASGKAEISLGTGPISVSAGFLKQTSEESVMTVRATFALTNTEMDLKTYLDRTGLTPTNPGDLKTAIDKLTATA